MTSSGKNYRRCELGKVISLLSQGMIGIPIYITDIKSYFRLLHPSVSQSSPFCLALF